MSSWPALGTKSQGINFSHQQHYFTHHTCHCCNTFENTVEMARQKVPKMSTENFYNCQESRFK